MDDQAGVGAVERRGALVGNQAQEPHRRRQRDRRRLADVAAALEPIEDARADSRQGWSIAARPCRRTGATCVPDAKRRSTSISGNAPPRSKWSERARAGIEPARRPPARGSRANAARASSRRATRWRSATSTVAPVSAGAAAASAQTRRTKRPGAVGQADAPAASACRAADCSAITWPLPRGPPLAQVVAGLDAGTRR